MQLLPPQDASQGVESAGNSRELSEAFSKFAAGRRFWIFHLLQLVQLLETLLRASHKRTFLSQPLYGLWSRKVPRSRRSSNYLSAEVLREITWTLAASRNPPPGESGKVSKFRTDNFSSCCRHSSLMG